MTKKTFLLLFTWLTAVTLYAQQDKSPKYSTYYYQRASLFESLPVTSEDIIFIGNSITDGGEALVAIRHKVYSTDWMLL